MTASVSRKCIYYTNIYPFGEVCTSICNCVCTILSTFPCVSSPSFSTERIASSKGMFSSSARWLHFLLISFNLMCATFTAPEAVFGSGLEPQVGEDGQHRKTCVRAFVRCHLIDLFFCKKCFTSLRPKPNLRHNCTLHTNSVTHSFLSSTLHTLESIFLNLIHAADGAVPPGGQVGAFFKNP